MTVKAYKNKKLLKLDPTSKVIIYFLIAVIVVLVVIITAILVGDQFPVVNNNNGNIEDYCSKYSNYSPQCCKDFPQYCK